MTVPFSALTLAYWLHMLATVAGLGGIAAMAIFILPAARKTKEPTAYAEFLGEVQKRLDPLLWLCLAVLTGTGLVQMSANPNYQGFLNVQNRWATAILAKHLLFLAMVACSAYLSWGILPKLRRLAMQRLKMDPEGLSTQASALARQENLLLRANLILGVLILALTAVARAS